MVVGWLVEMEVGGGGGGGGENERGWGSFGNM